MNSPPKKLSREKKKGKSNRGGFASSSSPQQPQLNVTEAAVAPLVHMGAVFSNT